MRTSWVLFFLLSASSLAKHPYLSTEHPVPIYSSLSIPLPNPSTSFEPSFWATLERATIITGGAERFPLGNRLGEVIPRYTIQRVIAKHLFRWARLEAAFPRVWGKERNICAVNFRVKLYIKVNSWKWKNNIHQWIKCAPSIEPNIQDIPA